MHISVAKFLLRVALLTSVHGGTGEPVQDASRSIELRARQGSGTRRKALCAACRRDGCMADILVRCAFRVDRKFMEEVQFFDLVPVLRSGARNVRARQQSRRDAIAGNAIKVHSIVDSTNFPPEGRRVEWRQSRTGVQSSPRQSELLGSIIINNLAREIEQ
jgi:hypothetical protein